MRVIAYASHSISNAECHYHSSKLEFLALKWVVCNRFHEYLYGGTFDVYTDKNQLTYVLTTAQQWVTSLASYNLKIYYKCGKQNVKADALNRIEWSKMEVVAALEWGSNAESSLPLPPEAVVSNSNTVAHLEQKLSTADWKREQTNDPDISPVLTLVEKKENLQNKSKSTDSQDQRILLKYRKDLVVKNSYYQKFLEKEHCRPFMMIWVIWEWIEPSVY